MSPATPVATLRTRTGPAGVGRSPVPRLPGPSSADSEARLPPDTATPGYSPETLALLDQLTPLERGVVEWRATNLPVAECYRRASGKVAAAKQSGHQIVKRPRVRAALAAVLNDRGCVPRYDREWQIMRLARFVDRCAETGTPAACRRLIAAIEAMSKLQGEWPTGRPGRRRATATSRPAVESGVMSPIKAILADADRVAAARPEPVVEGRRNGPQPATSPSSNALDRLVAEAEARARHRPAVVGQSTAAPSATPLAEDGPALAAVSAIEPATHALLPDHIKYAPGLRLAPDGRPFGEVRGFRGVGLIQRPETVDPPPAEPVVPQISYGPTRYNGGFPSFMGAWI